MTATFFDNEQKQIKTFHFGATGYLAYTIAPRDEERRKYSKRHKDKRKWNDEMTDGTLWRFILWEIMI